MDWEERERDDALNWSIARSACTAPHVALAMGNNQDTPRRQHGP
jgi:hypothetical protein